MTPARLATRTTLGAITLLATLAACRCGPAPRGDASEGAAANQAESFQLANGLAVDLLRSDREDAAAIVLLLDVGLRHDPPGRSGMALLVERIFPTARTPATPAGTLDALKAQHPLGFHTRVGADHTAFTFVVPPDRITATIDDLVARLSSLQVEAADLERERPHVLANLARLRGGEAEPTARTFAAEAIRPTPAQGWRGGVAEELEATTVEELRDFLEHHARATNARLVVIGRHDPATLRKHVESTAATIPAGTKPTLRGDENSRVTGTLVMGDAPSALALAVSAPAPTDPTYAAFLVLAARLERPTEPAKRWQSHFAPLESPEVLLVTDAIAPTETRREAAERVRREVSEAIAQPLGADEKARTLETYGPTLGLVPADATSLGAQAYALGRRAQLGLDPPSLAAAFDGLTAADLVEAAKRFTPESSAIVVAGGTIR